MAAANSLLLAALRNPAALVHLPAGQWNLLLRQARGGDLLGRLASVLEAVGALAQISPGPRSHLESAQQLARAQHAEVRREVERLVELFAPLGVPLVALKGAAYVYAGLPAAAGRIFSDIDIMLPKASLPQAEASLMLEGWVSMHRAAYDQLYYRQWMHELPPMQHTKRGAVLDVHHSILPDTARLKPDAAKLLQAIEPVAGTPGLHVLGRVDVVLHSMTHLFCNEEFSHGLRDLSDLDLLLRHFGGEAGFWDALLARSRELDLTRPLYYGLRYTHRLLGCPVPDAVLERSAGFAPPGPLLALMDRLWTRVLGSTVVTEQRTGRALAGLMLLIRAHWLRMPALLLARHLAVKMMRGSD